MSNPDSFIDEVSEEVRRDQFYGYLRRYGWIGATVIIAIVGGAAYVEWSKASAEADAQVSGGVIDSALQIEEPAARADALAEVTVGDADVVARFAQVTSLQQADDAEGAAALLEELMAGDGLYADLATLRRVGLPGAVPSPEERIALVEPIIAAGGSFSLLATEQRALALIEMGEVEEAQDILAGLLDAPLATGALRNRAAQMIFATGGTLDAGPVLVDPNAEEN
ncbi:hypothetical protein [Pontivivens insulae]|uniref:Tetratricopeptide repeat-like domain-containing protein n=1 Tax=Pontivivens insulae TaxID=1639689 RepID=A0A2R8AB95_9RHOB|nr:hypothetical protein [Pontivivens insulae]RED11313.1 hypothetical protein DFR53_3348 [Pontivivens insulae]SPF29514.1 hypothetical protein POI8812_01825 [Pontivivens insulae]